MTGKKRPEWADLNRPQDFSTSVIPGIESSHDGFNKGVGRKKFQKRAPHQFNVEELVQGVLQGNRISLSKAITFIESNAIHHFQTAQKILKQLLPHTGKSIRIGITGVPGAGKSTFIESFGHALCEKGHRVAVLAVDPSSTLNGGSILGDKTRMERLSNHPNAFIRPSPSEGTLGGVHRKTRETMLACEAAGYDVILIETVGVGQSEVIVRGMVDFFMLLVITGAGDELQGMKKGIMELADAIVVNKADGDNIPLARKTKREYNQVLHFLTPATSGWQSRAHTCSALYGDGINEIWEVVERFMQVTKNSGVFSKRRQKQAKEWLKAMITEKLQMTFFQHEEVRRLLPVIEDEVIKGNRTVSQAVEMLFAAYKIK